ncbi:hypothetical protein GW796_08130 [archaeon]|nr:hypothetical protein [archaeon]
MYNYIIEDNFANMTSIVSGINEVFKMPNEIIGCEFVNCRVIAESHDLVKKDFVLLFDVDFYMKSTS